MKRPFKHSCSIRHNANLCYAFVVRFWIENRIIFHFNRRILHLVEVKPQAERYREECHTPRSISQMEGIGDAFESWNDSDY